MASFDWKKLSRMDQGVVGAGALALIALFLPWYGYSSSDFSASVSGFSTSYGWLGGLLIIATGVYLFMLRSGQNVPKSSVGPGVLVLGGAALGAIIVIIRWLTLPKGSGAVGAVSYRYGADIGLYLTLIAGIVQAICSFNLFKASGEKLPWDNKASGS